MNLENKIAIVTGLNRGFGLSNFASIFKLGEQEFLNSWRILPEDLRKNYEKLEE